jgi:hypothetical protein
MIYGLLAVLAPDATAAVVLLYFRATPGSDKILVEWETATELETSGFNLYRSQDSGSKGKPVGDTFPARGDGITGAKYSYPDADIIQDVRYYYTLEEIPLGEGGPRIIGTANAGIDMPALTATSTATATATRTPTATTAPGTQSGGQPTATRRFTNTPPAGTQIPAPGLATTPQPAAAAPRTPIAGAIVSTPTGQPPTVAPVNAAATPLPPAEPTAFVAASPSPETVATSATQPVAEATPTAIQPPQVFAAATALPLSGTSERAASAPTPIPDDQADRSTGTVFVLGGGAILLAAAIGGGAILYLRSRQS